MPTITQLHYLLAVHKHRHFGRAAAELGVSQPTLSSQVQKAESELGVIIFDRQSKPISLTDHGGQLLELARAVVESHQKLLAVASGRFAELAGPFSLGIIPTLATYVLPWFLRQFASDFPRVELSIHERPTDDILAEISANRMDAAILATPLGEPTLVEERLFYDPFYLYAHPEEPILGSESLSVADIDSSRLWLLEDGHCFRAQVINLCGIGQRSLIPSVEFSGGSFETLRHLIDASGGYTLFPESFARTLPRSVRLKMVRAFSDQVPTREVSLVYHQRSWKAEVASAIARCVVANLPRCFERDLADGEVLPIRVK